MCGWKWSGFIFDWLVCCSGLNFSKWSRQLYICKYLICNERLSFGYFPGVWVLKADVSKHCRFHLQQVLKCECTCWRWNRHSVPKRRLLILRRRGNTQKTIFHYNNMAKAWKLESYLYSVTVPYCVYTCASQFCICVNILFVLHACDTQ
jgi:hypothetical protein